MRITAVLMALLFSARGADTLVAGATYYDSENTLLEVLELIRVKDSEGIGRLMSAHHISEAVLQDAPIEVLLRGNTPSSPAEFRFLNSPTTYWTMSKYIWAVIPVSNPAPAPTLAITPTPTPTPKPTPTPTATPTLTLKTKRTEKVAKRDVKEDGGDVVWHEVNGHMRWYNPRVHHAEKLKPKKRARVLRAEPAEPNVPTAQAVPKGQ